MFSIKRVFGRQSAEQKRDVVTERTVVDVRGDAERATELRARNPLDAPNERLAEIATALSLLITAIHGKSAAEGRLPQLEGFREKHGGISGHELDELIERERSDLQGAEKAIQALTTILQLHSVSVSTAEECSCLITELGRQLNEAGGQDLMELVAYRCQARGARLIYIQSAWDGIGKWRW